MKINIGQKKGSSVLLGLLLLIGGICLLWWNEGRTIHTAQAISEAEDNYTDVSAEKINKSYEGKLIATKGTMIINDENDLSDEDFGVSQRTAKLIRNVEMYQWKEECDENDNCSYSKIWSEALISSSNFTEMNGHENPTTMPYASATFYADKVSLGEFTVSQELLEQLSATETLVELNETTAQSLNLQIKNNYYTTYTETPNVGDVRISFSYNNADQISVLAVQKGNTFSTFESKTGVSIYELKEGNFTGAQIIKQLRDENNLLKWGLRGLGILLIIIGLNSIIQPIQRLASFVPILGSIFGYLTSLACSFVGLAVGLLVIAIAWFRFRPILSISLFAIIIVILIAVRVFSQKKDIGKQNLENNVI